ncbi:MAG: hypothetical protein IPJ07_11520 [Acidobacteria bacterium]|jgi:hypothetical protein|nr:hypothetical protein [Acidobacteriota bacterium]MBK9707940.1 hypothetical protein [Acidobacteriota bacterium]
MSQKTDKCENPICNCPARMDSEFCCEYCEKEHHEPEDGCKCGHPECRVSATMPTF